MAYVARDSCTLTVAVTKWRMNQPHAVSSCLPTKCHIGLDLHLHLASALRMHACVRACVCWRLIRGGGREIAAHFTPACSASAAVYLLALPCYYSLPFLPAWGFQLVGRE